MSSLRVHIDRTLTATDETDAPQDAAALDATAA
jgi:hypothetical protein